MLLLLRNYNYHIIYLNRILNVIYYVRNNICISYNCNTSVGIHMLILFYNQYDQTMNTK